MARYWLAVTGDAPTGGSIMNLVLWASDISPVRRFSTGSRVQVTHHKYRSVPGSADVYQVVRAESAGHALITFPGAGKHAYL